MGFLSRFEGKMEDTLEGAADKMFDAPISPVQIAKKAEKQMRRQKMVGAGKQYAPTLYTVLVNADDDRRLFGYYPTLAGEIETFLSARAVEEGLVMDGQPLVRFIGDEGLKHGKFEVIAEAVAAPIIMQLRDEEYERYGLGRKNAYGRNSYSAAGNGNVRDIRDLRDARNGRGGRNDYDSSYDDPYGDPYGNAAAQRPRKKEPLPYVPEDEIDYSIDYGEYTFNSQDFEDYRDHGPSSVPLNPEDDYTDNYTDDYSDNYSDNDYDDYDYNESEDAGFVMANPDDYQEDGKGGFVPSNKFAQSGKFAQSEQDPYEPEDLDPQPQRPQIPPVQPTMEFVKTGNAAGMPDQALVRARLVDIKTGHKYMLASNRLIVGRATTSDIKIDDINVSRTHAEIRFEPQGIWTITDLGSANGTFVNNMDVSSAPLAEGDIISLGMTDLEFSLV